MYQFLFGERGARFVSFYLTSARLLRTTAFAVGCAVAVATASAQNTSWTNTVLGNWFIPGNWSNGVPGGNQFAFIANGGTAFINSHGAVSSGLNVGGPFGGGVLLISNGGTLEQLVDAGIGAANFTGSVTVSNNGSRWNVRNGLIVYGNGSPRIDSGADVVSAFGRVDGSIAANGSATITGAGSTWTVTGSPGRASIFDIGSFGKGLFTISGGGTLNNGFAAFIGGGSSGTTGTATVTGPGSFWNNGGHLYVGAHNSGGVGALRISDRGVVQAGALRVSNTGSVEVNNGQSTVAGLILTGGASQLALDGELGSLIVASNTSGRMIVINGGVARNAVGIVGRGVGQTGTVTVDGAGAQWINSGDVLVGESGNGTLEIRSGGKVSNLRGHVGFNTGSSGSVIVRDPGSTWTGGGSFFIGNGGTGSLQVRDAGVASTAGNSYLGFSPGAAGSATVSGPGSKWNTAVTLIIGGNFNGPGGSGLLRIENGGTVNTASTILYNTGVLELAGATTFTGPLTSHGGLVRSFGDTALTNDITLGNGGLSVNLTSGSNSTFGGIISGSGGLTMSSIGAGSTLTLTGNNTYTGATTVNSGRLVVEGSITSSLTLENGATLDGSGTVGPVIIRNGGIVAPGNSPGLLTVGDTLIEGGGAYLLDLRSDGTGVAGTDWDSLAVNGTLDTTALTEANPFILRLQTLDSDNDLNYLEVWDRNVSHTWDSVLTSVALLGGDFDPRVIEVDATGFQNPIHGTFSVVQEGTNLNLQYDPAVGTLPGDYNQDGTVDAADYVVWRSTLDQSGTTLAADGNGNSQIDLGDYDVWRANFGTTLGAGAVDPLSRVPPSAESLSAAVPEPSSWALFCLAMIAVGVRRASHKP